MAGTRNTNHGTGICAGCRAEKSLTANLRIRSHKIDGVSCAGGSDLPYDPAKDADVLMDVSPAAAPVDDPFGDDAETDPTDASTWTTVTDDRPTKFDVKNAMKAMASPGVPDEIMAEAERIIEQAETEGYQGEPRRDSAMALPEMGQTDDPPHIHRFEYMDDLNGHSGSSCDCGAMEPNASAKPSHGGPNPHRAPLPRGHLAAVPDVPPETLAGAAAFLDGEIPFPDSWSTQTTVPDDVNAFMGGGSTVGRASTQDQINDFMGNDEPEEEKTPVWFPAKYDGNCESCGADFGEGEEIRADGSGGWEARECCGEDSAATERAVQERPKVVYPKPPVRNGRYHLPHPETGEKANWTRVTNFNKKTSDHFALEQWGNRCLAVGLKKRGDLFRQLDGKDVKADRNFLNKLVEDAKQAAGSKDRARLGTIMHKHTEQVDAGHKTLGDVPDQFRNDVSVYLAKMRATGLMMVPHLMERSTVVTELGVAGTFDGVVRLPDGTYAVGDKKTGETLEYNQFEIAVQLAVYAHGANSAGIAVAVPSNVEGELPTWDWEPLTDEDGNRITVREDIGIVIHLPYGSGDCFIYEIPLNVGWEGAQLCKRVQESQKIKHIITAMPEIQPSGIVAELEKATAGVGTVADIFAEAEKGFEVPTAANTGKTQVMIWMDRFAGVTSKDEALKLYGEAQAAGTSAPVLKAMVEVGKGALQKLAAKRVVSAVPDKPQAVHPAASLAPEPEGAEEKAWEAKFAAVKSKVEALELYQKAKEAGMSPTVLQGMVETGMSRLRSLETKPLDNPDPLPEESWEGRFAAVISKTEAAALYRGAKSKGLTPGRLVELAEIGRAALKKIEEAAEPEPTWEDRFKAITTKDQARELYQEAKDQVSPERLKNLVDLGKKALPPTWEDRFRGVKSKAEASALYAEAHSQVAKLGVNRLNALVKLAREALSYLEEPPF